MRIFVSGITAVLLLGMFAAGCDEKKQREEVSGSPNPSVSAAAETQSDTETQNVSIEGQLQYEDLEGGCWRLLTSEQRWVLREAVGCPPIETMISQAKLSSGKQAVVHGYPASDEGNIGIHMAGPYFVVRSINAKK